MTKKDSNTFAIEIPIDCDQKVKHDESCSCNSGHSNYGPYPNVTSDEEDSSGKRKLSRTI